MLKIDEELIVKYLDGEASPEEAIAIDDWRNASLENRTLFEHIEQSVSIFDRGKKFVAPNVTTEWLKLKGETIDANKNLETRIKSHLPKTRTFFTPLRAAASIAVIAGIATALYIANFKTDQTQTLTKQSAGEIVKTNLADNSTVTQFRNTIISFPTTFDNKIRAVNLIKGEAYFDVAHNPEKPFVVTVNELQVKVLGTAFDIRNNEASNTIEIQVVRGSVLIYNEYGSEVVNAGHTGTYYREARRFEVSGTTLSNHNTVGYATQSFDFTDVTLEEVAKHLSKTFDVTFNFKNEKLKNCRMNGEFNDRSLDFILKVISATFEIKYSKEGKTIELSGNACD